MRITEVRISLRDDFKLKAFASIVFDDYFVIRGVKIIQSQTRLSVAMPSRKRKDGDYQEICHPTTDSTRKWIEDIVLKKYREALNRPADDVDGLDSSGVRSPIFPTFGPLMAGEARELEWDADEAEAGG